MSRLYSWVVLLLSGLVLAQVDNVGPAWINPAPSTPMTLGLTQYPLWTEGDTVELLAANVNSNFSFMIRQMSSVGQQKIPHPGAWKVNAGIVRYQWKIGLDGLDGNPYFDMSQGSDFFTLQIVTGDKGDQIESDYICIRTIVSLSGNSSASTTKSAISTQAANSWPLDVTGSDIAAIVLGVFLVITWGLLVLILVVIRKESRHQDGRACRNGEEETALCVDDKPQDPPPRYSSSSSQ